MKNRTNLMLKAGILTALLWGTTPPADACTGIALTARDGSFVQGRTIEWAKEPLPSQYVIIPRGETLTSLLPDGRSTGMRFTAKWGAVGLAVMQKEFIAEGINEAGLSVGLFFFPRYGSYARYSPLHAERTVCDLQLTSWMLTQCATIDELRKELPKLHVVGLVEESVVHWRIADASGRQMVLEIVNGVLQWHTNTVGVLTNAPDFQWHLTNLNNYVNLFPGDAPWGLVGHRTLRPLGGSSGMLGLPGDATPPSRFVRAAFLRATAPEPAGAIEAVTLCFHLLNNFDVPVGIEHPLGGCPDIPSATQWTSVIDLTHRRVYYKTAYNNHIRCIDLTDIDFGRVKYQAYALDEVQEQPVEYIKIK